MRATAPKGVRLREGEKLCRVNPMSGSGLTIGRCRREETVKRVRNPGGGTNRVWKPGIVDLRAGAAVGAENLRRVAGVGRLRRGLPGPSKHPRDSLAAIRFTAAASSFPRPRGIQESRCPAPKRRKLPWTSASLQGSRNVPAGSRRIRHPSWGSSPLQRQRREGPLTRASTPGSFRLQGFSPS
jgi:hypothetical protein